MVWKGKDASSDDDMIWLFIWLSDFDCGIVLRLPMPESHCYNINALVFCKYFECGIIYRWWHGEWGGQDTNEPWGKRKSPNFRHRVLEHVRLSHLGAAGVGAAEQPVVVLQPVQLLRFDGPGARATQQSLCLQPASSYTETRADAPAYPAHAHPSTRRIAVWIAGARAGKQLTGGWPEPRGAVFRLDSRRTWTPQEAVRLEGNGMSRLCGTHVARQWVAQELVCRLAGSRAEAVHLHLLFDGAGAAPAEQPVGLGHPILLRLEFLFALYAPRWGVAGRSEEEWGGEWGDKRTMCWDPFDVEMKSVKSDF